MRGQALWRLIRELVLSVIMAIALFVLIDSVTVRSHVEGPSMEPTLHTGQMLLINRLGISGLTQKAFASVEAVASIRSDAAVPTSAWTPTRGAIVTFLHPYDPNTMLVKRVIGLPGEVIRIDHGSVYIDGQRLAEPYVVYHDAVSLAPERIPADSIFVMGDNRPESGDSRSFGPIPMDRMLGVVVLRYFPFTQLAWFLGN